MKKNTLERIILKAAAEQATLFFLTGRPLSELEKAAIAILKRRRKQSIKNP